MSGTYSQGALHYEKKNTKKEKKAQTKIPTGTNKVAAAAGFFFLSFFFNAHKYLREVRQS